MADIAKKDFVPTESNLTPQNISKFVVGAGLIGLAAYGFGTYVLPWLVTFAWNIVSLAVAFGIAAPLLLLLTNPRFWRALGYFNNAITKIMLFWLIEFDEFIIQEQQIEQAEKDVEDFVKAKESLEGSKAKMERDISERQRLKDEYYAMGKVAERDNNSEQADDYYAEANAHNTFIQTLIPYKQDMEEIIVFSDKLEKVMLRKIKELKRELKLAKDTYAAVTAGASALASAKKAIFGNRELNSDAEQAKERMRVKMGQLNGEIRNSMKALKGIQTEESYRDKAKMQLAKQQIMEIAGEQTIDVPVEVLRTTIGTKSGVLIQNNNNHNPFEGIL
jgi:hypothetical protein